MMHEREKSDPAIVARKPANKAGRSVAELVSEGRGPRGTRASKARAGHRTGIACHRRWTVCVKARRSSAWRQIPLVRAGCLNWARPDLCGGRSAMTVPTANTDDILQAAPSPSIAGSIRSSYFYRHRMEVS